MKEGHCEMNRHLNRLRLSNTLRCHCVDRDEETGMHLICTCLKFLQLRHRMLGESEAVPSSNAAAVGPEILERS